MRDKIKGWLSIDYLNQEIINLRLRCAVLESELKKCEDGGLIFEGGVAKVDSLKEFVYGMAKYLKLRPRKTYKEVPVEPATTKTERVYEVIKIK